MTTPPITPDQSDREAAAEIYGEDVISAKLCRDGTYDNIPIVQAFTAHRQKAVAAERARCAAIVESWNGKTEDGNTFLIAAAIKGANQ